MRAIVRPEVESYATMNGIALEVIYRAEGGYASDQKNLMLGVEMTLSEADELGDRLKGLARIQRAAQAHRHG